MHWTIHYQQPYLYATRKLLSLLLLMLIAGQLMVTQHALLLADWGMVRGCLQASNKMCERGDVLTSCLPTGG
jgi:hypothetical protein